jgi:hypothetical protein
MLTAADFSRSNLVRSFLGEVGCDIPPAAAPAE